MPIRPRGHGSVAAPAQMNPPARRTYPAAKQRYHGSRRNRLLYVRHLLVHGILRHSQKSEANKIFSLRIRGKEQETNTRDKFRVHSEPYTYVEEITFGDGKNRMGAVTEGYMGRTRGTTPASFKVDKDTQIRFVSGALLREGVVTNSIPVVVVTIVGHKVTGGIH